MKQKQAITEITLATTNAGKKKEFELAMREFNLTIRQMQGEFNCPEDGNSFLENATQKAQLASKLTNSFCLADDSGLCVQALGGSPGIHSARYFGKGEGISKILHELENKYATPEGAKINKYATLTALKDAENRKAYFVCCLVLTAPDQSVIWQTEQHWHGQIAQQAMGTNGFGYDPIFIPDGMELTAAELSPIEKEKISHRGKAIAEFKHFIKSCQDGVL